MSSEKKNKGWQKIRKFFNDVHLWIGLGSGLIVIVICFTGTVYVFHTEFREMASPELYKHRSVPAGVVLSPEEIIMKVEKATGGKVSSLKISADRNRLWQVSVKKDKPEEVGKKSEEGANANGEKSVSANAKDKGNGRSEKPGGGRAGMGTSYAVNQYSGEIIGDISNHKNGTTEFLRTMFSLHRWLMLDRIEEPLFGELPNRKLGSYITGGATILFTLGVLTGMVIWFPQKIKSWKQGLTIKWDAKWKRLNHDLHNTLAFYSLIFLFLMGITGPQWSFEWYREGLQKTLGTYRGPDQTGDKPLKSEIIPNKVTAKVSLTGLLKITDEALSYSGDYSIALPSDSLSPVVFSKTKTGFFAPAASDKISLDQYSGMILSTEKFSDKPFNERIAGSIKSLHLGDVYGKFSKILYFLACLVATSLPVTGTIIWINKLDKKKNKKEKKKRLTGEVTSEL